MDCDTVYLCVHILSAHLSRVSLVVVVHWSSVTLTEYQALPRQSHSLSSPTTINILHHVHTISQEECWELLGPNSLFLCEIFHTSLNNSPSPRQANNMFEEGHPDQCLRCHSVRFHPQWIISSEPMSYLLNWAYIIQPILRLNPHACSILISNSAQGVHLRNYIVHLMP